ncbi:hypothetical protein AAZX31_11G006900 [Glycine max]
MLDQLNKLWEIDRRKGAHAAIISTHTFAVRALFSSCQSRIICFLFISLLTFFPFPLSSLNFSTPRVTADRVSLYISF